MGDVSMVLSMWPPSLLPHRSSLRSTTRPASMPLLPTMPQLSTRRPPLTTRRLPRLCPRMRNPQCVPLRRRTASKEEIRTAFERRLNTKFIVARGSRGRALDSIYIVIWHKSSGAGLVGE